jgi:hypothetical protein
MSQDYKVTFDLSVQKEKNKNRRIFGRINNYLNKEAFSGRRLTVRLRERRERITQLRNTKWLNDTNDWEVVAQLNQYRCSHYGFVVLSS